MEEQKWITSNPDFHRIMDDFVNVVGNSELEQEFYKYALNYKKSAHILTNHLFESSPNIRKLDTYFFL